VRDRSAVALAPFVIPYHHTLVTIAGERRERETKIGRGSRMYNAVLGSPLEISAAEPGWAKAFEDLQ
jgi:hypothetical protein